MWQFLIDTNTLSELGRPQPSALAKQRMIRHAEVIATASPVYQELLFSLYRLPPSRRRQHVERYVLDAVRSTMPILPYDTSAAEWHAAERARLVRAGRTPPFIDGQIAAIAVTNGLTLVTKNWRDFQHFSDLQLEDWTI